MKGMKSLSKGLKRADAAYSKLNLNTLFGNIDIDAGDHELNYVIANRFYVEMEDTITACFTECDGLEMKMEGNTFQKFFEGGVNDQQRIMLGQAEFENITLKRGITNDLTFWDWVSDMFVPKAKWRRNIRILLFNQAGETMQSWTLKGAVPVGWKAPALKSDATEVAIEQLTLAYEGLEVLNEQDSSSTMFTQRDKLGYF